MSDIHTIPISIESLQIDSDLTTQTLLHEIKQMLSALVTAGINNTIDLKTIPLTTGTYQQLKAALGQGEIQVEINLMGITSVIETSISGVWWLTHKNEEGSVISELIEVTRIPDILVTDMLDISAGIKQLESRIEERQPSNNDVAIGRNIG